MPATVAHFYLCEFATVNSLIPFPPFCPLAPLYPWCTAFPCQFANRIRLEPFLANFQTANCFRLHTFWYVRCWLSCLDAVRILASKIDTTSLITKLFRRMHMAQMDHTDLLTELSTRVNSNPVTSHTTLTGFWQMLRYVNIKWSGNLVSLNRCLWSHPLFGRPEFWQNIEGRFTFARLGLLKHLSNRCCRWGDLLVEDRWATCILTTGNENARFISPAEHTEQFESRNNALPLM